MAKFKNLQERFNLTDKTLRIISAIVMLLLGFTIFKTGFIGVTLLCLIITGIMIYEYDKMFNQRRLGLKYYFSLISILGVLIVFSANFITLKFPVYYFSIAFICIFCILNIINIASDSKHWILESLPPIYIGFGILSVLYIYMYSSILSLIYIFIITISTDTGAYFIGRALKGPKLWQRVSPNKTWSGALGGTFCAFTFSTSYIIGSFWVSGLDNFQNVLIWGCISVILSIISQSGDLFESFIKRLTGIKDSSNFIPGHGGVLDRFDSILFVAPAMALIIAFTKVGYLIL